MASLSEFRMKRVSASNALLTAFSALALAAIAAGCGVNSAPPL